MTRTMVAEEGNPLIGKYRDRFEGAAKGEPLSFAEARELFQGFMKLDQRMARIARISDGYQGEIKALVEELQNALDNLSLLKGCIPICATCKKVRTDEGYWKQLEQYLSEHSDLLFSHGLCPDCSASYLAQSRSYRVGPAPAPQPSTGAFQSEDFDDPVLAEFLPLVHHPHFADSPLAGAFSNLFQKYLRLSRRMNRIARISDSYQSNLQDLKSRLDLASRTDYMTGLPNRREMYERLAVEESRGRRHAKVFAVVMLDFDRFKEINDHYGHPIGDRILAAAAELLIKPLRREDSCGRWGGEEFLLLLPETDQAQAMVVAEKVRSMIEGLALEIEGAVVRTTISLGGTVFCLGEALDRCMARADAALYRAKEEGRNRTVFLAGGC